MKRLPPILMLFALALAAGCTMPSHEAATAYNEKSLIKEGMIALKPGDAAPPFSALLDNGKEISLETELKQNRVMLFFYPANDTPNSAKHLIALGKAQAELAAAKVVVYAVNPGTPAEGQAFLAKYKILLPLLEDEDHSLAVKYGCAVPGYHYPQRTLVGINSDGTVAFFYRGMFALPNPTKQVLEKFGSGAAPAASPGVPAGATGTSPPAAGSSPAEGSPGSPAAPPAGGSGK